MALPVNRLPSFTTTIPSTGELIKYVPFTNGQEKLLLTAAESDNPSDNVTAIKDLIKECYQGIVVDKLTSYDIDYLFIQLRIQSVSNISELYFKSMQCGKTGKECEKTLKLNINLNDITVQQYDAESDEYKTYSPIQYKNGGIAIQITDSVGIVIKHPGFDAQEKYSKLKNPSEDDLIKLCIVSIYDDETVNTRDDFTDEELDEFYDTLLSNQLTPLYTFIRNIPKVRYEAEFKCKECGFREPLVFEDFTSFFS